MLCTLMLKVCHFQSVKKLLHRVDVSMSHVKHIATHIGRLSSLHLFTLFAVVKLRVTCHARKTKNRLYIKYTSSHHTYVAIYRYKDDSVTPRYN